MLRLTQDIPAPRRFRVGMVGGGRGAYFAGLHRAAMRLSNRFELVAGAFSSDAETSLSAGAALGIAPERTYASFVDMARAEAACHDNRLDLVVIVTPNHLHYEPCRMFLEAGIAVICDKPLVHTSAEARDLLRISREKSLLLGVTYTYTGYPMVRDARARIRAGEIGDVRMMYAEYLLEWLANDQSDVGKGAIWRGDPAKAGITGCMGDIGTHAFNMLEFVSGQRCTAINARLDRTVPGFGLDDSDMAMMEFDGRASGIMWCSLAAPGHGNGLRFKIVGTRGTLEWVQESPETLKLYRLGEADLTYHRGRRDTTPDALEATSLPPGCPESYLEALAVLYGDYATALEAGSGWRHGTRVPIADAYEGLRGVLLSEVSLQSSAARAWVDFPAG